MLVDIVVKAMTSLAISGVILTISCSVMLLSDRLVLDGRTLREYFRKSKSFQRLARHRGKGENTIKPDTRAIISCPKTSVWLAAGPMSGRSSARRSVLCHRTSGHDGAHRVGILQQAVRLGGAVQKPLPRETDETSPE